MEYHLDLINDMHNEIMELLIKDDPVGASMLACTCKTEFERYLKLVPSWKRLTYRQILINIYPYEYIRYDSYYNIVLPGDKNYNYLQKKYEKDINKIKRSESIRPIARKKEKRIQKENKYLRKQWKDKNYD